MGVVAAFAAAGIWPGMQFAFPPLPTNVGGSVVAVGFGVAAVVLVGTARDGSAGNAALAALLVRSPGGVGHRCRQGY